MLSVFRRSDGLPYLAPVIDRGRLVLARLVEAGVTQLRTSRPSLEEVYVHIIGDRGLKV